MDYEKLKDENKGASSGSICRIVLLLCMILGIGVTAIIIRKTISDNRRIVEYYRAEIDDVIADKIELINDMADELNDQNDDFDYLSYVISENNKYDDIREVYIFVEDPNTENVDGLAKYSSGGWEPSKNFRGTGSPWYTNAYEYDYVYITTPYIIEGETNVMITMSKRICKAGRPIGVVFIDMYMADIHLLIRSSYEGDNYVFITNKDGNIVYHPDWKLELSYGNFINVAEARAGMYYKVCQSELKDCLIVDYSGGLKFAINSKAEVTGWNIVAVNAIGWGGLVAGLVGIVGLLGTITLWIIRPPKGWISGEK